MNTKQPAFYCESLHLFVLQLPDGRVAAPLHQPEALLQLPTLPLGHGRGVHRLMEKKHQLIS